MYDREIVMDSYGSLMLTFSDYKDDSFDSPSAYTWTLRPQFDECNYYPISSFNDAFEGEGYEKLFDGKEDTKWCCDELEDQWSVEFMSK